MRSDAAPRASTREHEQAIIQLALRWASSFTSLWTAARDGRRHPGRSCTHAATVIYLLLSITIQASPDYWWRIGHPAVMRDNCRQRRHPFFMAMMGEDGAWMFGLYLFVIF